jgi:hypothetical protein
MQKCDLRWQAAIYSGERMPCPIFQREAIQLARE